MLKSTFIFVALFGVIALPPADAQTTPARPSITPVFSWAATGFSGTVAERAQILVVIAAYRHVELGDTAHMRQCEAMRAAVLDSSDIAAAERNWGLRASYLDNSPSACIAVTPYIPALGNVRRIGITSIEVQDTTAIATVAVVASGTSHHEKYFLLRHGAAGRFFVVKVEIGSTLYFR